MFSETIDQIERMLRSCTGEEDALLVDGGDHADIASTVAFALAKKQKKAPALIAAELALEIRARPEMEGITVSAVGPYLNFVFGGDYLARSVAEARRPGYGTLSKKHERVLLEHTSANPNGPLHVWHIRNTIIGDTLA
ncbi:MAG: arginine--tRNA ligase, partial [Methanocalculus sp.]|nr:arginine--tRNA ligase [Methanocalculus sp.]